MGAICSGRELWAKRCFIYIKLWVYYVREITTCLFVLCLRICVRGIDILVWRVLYCSHTRIIDESRTLRHLPRIEWARH